MTKLYPDIAPALENFSTGLWPMKLSAKYFLVIKVPEQFLLTVQLSKGFTFYLAPVDVGSIETFALITAFYDIDESPLVLTTSLLAGACLRQDFLQLVRTDSFDVLLLNDHNREILSYRASGDFHTLRERVASAVLVNAENACAMLDKAETWYARRDSADDAQAVNAHLGEQLLPENFSISNGRSLKTRFESEPSLSRFSQPIVPVQHAQKHDVAFLFERIYPSSRVHLNPIKTLNGQEMVDIMVIGDEAVLLIQAKTSADTQTRLRPELEHERSKSIQRIDRGAGLLGDAISQIKRDPTLLLRTGDDVIEVDLTGRFIIGIIVVEQLFHGLYTDYSAKAFEFIDRHQTPMLFFDYPQLDEAISQCLSKDTCVSENTFLAITDQIFAIAVERREFPILPCNSFCHT